MLKLLLFFILWTIPTSVLATEKLDNSKKYCIEGCVVGDYNAPITDAIIRVEGTTFCSFVDEMGQFKLQFKADLQKVELKVVAMGYKTCYFLYREVYGLNDTRIELESEVPVDGSLFYSVYNISY